MNNILIFSCIIIANWLNTFGWLFGLAINDIIIKIKDKKAKKGE